jgi:cytochrome c-type biogenesis protein CcmH/NrfG
MIARITYTVVSVALLLGFLVIVATGVQLISSGSALGIGMGISAEVLVLLGVWFLWKTYQFGRRSGALARELEAEGALPADGPTRSAGGRIDRDSADAVFARRRAEAEATPDDWRSWFRLAVAYADARDTPRARKAMQRAIKLHDARA